MDGASNKAILGERILSGAASSALSIGMVLALVSLSGAGVVRQAIKPTLSTFDLAQQTRERGSGAQKPAPVQPPPRPETPSAQMGRPDVPELGRVPPSRPEPEGSAAQAQAVKVEMPAPARVIEQQASDVRLEKPSEAPSESKPQAAVRNQGKASAAADAGYKGEVWRHLQRFRRPNAVGPGSAFVSFTVGGGGNVVELGIAQSSGSTRFDGEALQMVRRAQPFPKPPQEVGRSFVFEIKGQ